MWKCSMTCYYSLLFSSTHQALIHCRVFALWKGKKDMTLNDELPRSVDAQHTTGEEQRNSSGRNEEAEPKCKQCPVMDVSGVESKIWCYKEQYYIGIWIAKSMNQCKLEVVKQEVARVNIDILGISKLKWTRRGEFNSDDHYIYHCGHEYLRRNWVALIINKRVWNAVLGCNLKKDRMISDVSKKNHLLS